VPFGLGSSVVMSPVLSSVLMPLIVFGLAVGVVLGADRSVSKNTEPPGVGLEQPLDAVVEIGCLDGVPSEYFMFGRSLSL
jgi:hypothetical protein